MVRGQAQHLKRYPLDWHVERLRGRLRFRQLVISMGQQNGKSLLGAIFDPPTWAAVKAGQLTGWSIDGVGRRVTRTR